MAEKKAKKTAGDNDDARQQNLDDAMAQITKTYGEGSIMRLGTARAQSSIEGISTGALSLDLALGIGGVPKGRIVEIYGPESSGKTTVILHVVANAQKAGGVCAFIDAEHALDPQYAKKLGVNLDDLLVSQPDSGEEALTICETLARSGSLDVIVIDSVAALVPKAELEGDMGMATMGMQARLMSQALRKLAAIMAKAKTTCVFTNQLREKVGVMFGSPETTPGGKALKFYASVRIDIRRIGAIKDGDKVIGGRTRVKVVKNKVAPPFRLAEFDIMYGEGISTEGDLIDLAVEHRIIEKSGAWFSYNNERLGQGREKVKNLLRDKTELANTIEAQVRKTLGLVQTNTQKPNDTRTDQTET